MGDEGNSDGGYSDREDNKAGYRSPVVLQISERRVVSGIEQRGRDEKRQRKLRRDVERSRARNQREQRAAQREEYRIRCSHAARGRRQNHCRDEKTKKLFESPHDGRLPIEFLGGYYELQNASAFNQD